MPSELRAVVVGCGRIGSTFAQEARIPGVHAHAQAYAEHPQYRLTAVCDTDPLRREAASLAWNAPAFADPVEACRASGADVVSICTPDGTHRALAERLLLEVRPRVLFMEKPLATTAAQAAELLALARKQGCTLVVNHSRRFSPAFRAVKEDLVSGLLGRPILVRLLYGKGLLHNGTHALDLLRFWLGEPARASGRPSAPGPEGDSTWDVDLAWDNGAHGRLDGFDDAHATVFEGDLLTTKARVRFSLGGERWEFFLAQDSPLFRGYRSFVPTDRGSTDPAFQHPLGACLPTALDEIAAHLEDGRPVSCTGEDGLRALEWIERLRGRP